MNSRRRGYITDDTFHGSVKELERVLAQKISQYANMNVLYKKFTDGSNRTQPMTPAITKRLMNYFFLYVDDDLLNKFIEKYRITEEGLIDFRTFVNELSTPDFDADQFSKCFAGYAKQQINLPKVKVPPFGGSYNDLCELLRQSYTSMSNSRSHELWKSIAYQSPTIGISQLRALLFKIGFNITDDHLNQLYNDMNQPPNPSGEISEKQLISWMVPPDYGNLWYNNKKMYKNPKKKQFPGMEHDDIDFSNNDPIPVRNRFIYQPISPLNMNPQPPPPPQQQQQQQFQSHDIPPRRCYYMPEKQLKKKQDLPVAPGEAIISPEEKKQISEYREQQHRLYNENVEKCTEAAISNATLGKNQDYANNKIRAMKNNDLW